MLTQLDGIRWDNECPTCKRNANKIKRGALKANEVIVIVPDAEYRHKTQQHIQICKMDKDGKITDGDN